MRATRARSTQLGQDRRHGNMLCSFAQTHCLLLDEDNKGPEIGLPETLQLDERLPTVVIVAIVAVTIAATSTPLSMLLLPPLHSDFDLEGFFLKPILQNL